MSSISTYRRPAGLKSSGTDSGQVRSAENCGEISTHSVACAICEAVYMPSPRRQDLSQASQEVLEVAFMSMCHYCFRCRKAACPQCWDAVHKVCGACVLDAHLPFRAESSPLQGTAFPPLASQVGHVESTGTGTRTASDEPIAPLLICVRPGRFQASTAASDRTVTPLSSPDVRPAADLLASGRADTSAVGAIHRPLQDSGEDSSWTEVDVPLRTWAKFFGMVERMLNVVLGAILLFIVVLVVLAMLSPAANAQILALLHVDIRSDIAYIFYVIRQLHW